MAKPGHEEILDDVDVIDAPLKLSALTDVVDANQKGLLPLLWDLLEGYSLGSALILKAKLLGSESTVKGCCFSSRFRS